MTRKILRLSITTLALLTAPIVARAETGPRYHFTGEIKIGGEGGWDYLSIDERAHRLYVTHGTKVIVIDLESHKIAGEILDTPGVHGFALAPELHLGFASNGTEAKVSVVDLKTLRTLAKVPTGEKPDAILFEPSSSAVYAFNGKGKSATIFDAKSHEVLATTPLPGKPEFAACDPAAGRVYCNIEDKSEVVAIDTKSHAVVNTWPIAPGEEASGMAIDLAHHRLFLGCGNQMMIMMDSSNGHVAGSVPIGTGVDANAFDPGTQLAFSSNGEGTVTIVHEDTADKLIVAQTLATQRGARTMALDPLTHKIYLAVAEIDPTSPPKGRPKFIPGTFKILIYELK